MLKLFRSAQIPSFRRFLSTTTSEAGNAAAEVEEDFEPVKLAKNPYEKEQHVCVLCKEKVKLDYKNSRLLQQFVSSFSGRVYEQHVTGLCDKQYRTLLSTIALSRKAGYMPILTKDPKYLRDPKLFDPMRSVRPHSYA